MGICQWFVLLQFRNDRRKGSPKSSVSVLSISSDIGTSRVESRVHQYEWTRKPEGSHPLSFIWPGHHGHHGHPNGHTLAWNIQPFSVARLLLHTQTCQTLDPSASRTSKKGRHWNGVKYLTLMFTMQWLNFECPCSNVWICLYVSFSILWSLQCITQKCRVIPQIPCLKLGPFIVYGFRRLVRLPQSYLWSSVGLCFCLCFDCLHPLGITQNSPFQSLPSVPSPLNRPPRRHFDIWHMFVLDILEIRLAFWNPISTWWHIVSNILWCLLWPNAWAGVF